MLQVTYKCNQCGKEEQMPFTCRADVVSYYPPLWLLLEVAPGQEFNFCKGECVDDFFNKFNRSKENG